MPSQKNFFFIKRKFFIISNYITYTNFMLLCSFLVVLRCLEGKGGNLKILKNFNDNYFLWFNVSRCLNKWCYFIEIFGKVWLLGITLFIICYYYYVQRNKSFTMSVLFLLSLARKKCIIYILLTQYSLYVKHT